MTREEVDQRSQQVRERHGKHEGDQDFLQAVHECEYDAKRNDHQTRDHDDVADAHFGDVFLAEHHVAERRRSVNWLTVYDRGVLVRVDRCVV